MINRVDVVEVSPRDGLQNESTLLPTAIKVELVQRLVDAGARRIEVVSFAHPRLVPAMADAEQVMAAIPRTPGVSYIGLVLNRRGLSRALAAGVDEVNAVVAASETFSQRNQACSTQEALDAAEAVVAGAREAGLRASVTFATAFGCPFEGPVPHDRVVRLARRAQEFGADEVALGDTVGVGVPTQVRAFGQELGPLRYHFHNTRNTGFANAYAAVLEGASALDASAGGIGGCPFAPRATGNIATEDLVFALERMGVATGYDLSLLLPVAPFLADQLGHEVPALLGRAGLPA